MNFDPKRRSSAVDLLGHSFIEKASDPSYIVDYVLKDLPPLADRFATLNSGDAAVASLVQSMGSVQELPMCSSLPVKIEWSFHEETTPPATKKGRFTIKREPASPLRRTASGDLARDESEIDSLTRKVHELMSENANLRQQVADLQATVAQLSERLRTADV
jgi:hypothetical protein